MPTTPLPAPPAASRDLSLKILRTLEGNQAFCVPTLALALGALSLGADDLLGSQIEELVGSLDFWKTFSLEGEEGGPTVEKSLSLWTDGRTPVNPRFIGEVKSTFDALVKATDFRGKAQKEISDFVAQATHDLILGFGESVPTTTESMLLSTLFFKGLWQTQFSKAKTQDLPFDAATKVVRVPTMMKHFKSREARLARNEKNQILQLPYVGDRYNAYFVLPNDLDQFLAAPSWREAVGPCEFFYGQGGIKVELPKFKLETTLMLSEKLETLGLTALSASGHLDGIHPGFFAANVLQKNVVIVDEEGTEAASVTGILMMRSASIAPPPEIIKFDRPFIFVIRDEVSGADLFVATIRNPAQ